MPRHVALQHFQDEVGGNRQDGAIVAPCRRVSDVIRLAGVEEKDLIGVGDDRLPAALTDENPSADEDDTVPDARFLRPFPVDVGPAPEVLDHDPQPVGKYAPCLGRRWRLNRDVTHGVAPGILRAITYSPVSRQLSPLS